MSDATRMLLATTIPDGLDTAVLGECIDACSACAQTCATCADACLHEYDLHRDCVDSCLTCADVCALTARVLSRTNAADHHLRSGIVELCARACAAAAGHCEEHAGTAKHCGVCAEACRRCERACQQLLAAFAALAV